MDCVWIEDYKLPKRESLNNDIKTDITIIGAGMCGILISFMLKEAGINSIIIEANKVANGITKNTTAKITSQHNLIYKKLITNFGYKRAKQYLVANQEAVSLYQLFITSLNIDCDFEVKPSYVYSTSDTKEIEAEIKACQSLGMKAEFTDKLDLPFPIKGAVKFDNQAQFNPIKFIKSISKELKIYENTKALAINEDVIVTNRGKIKSKLIVVATHFPFLNIPGYYFARMYQQRSYVIVLENAPKLNGMYIDQSDEGYSFRTYKNLLLLGGSSHRTGQNDGSCYKKLRLAANKLYPLSKEVYRFSNQDCMTLDSIPYIGRYSKSTPTLYVATGFNKWGMTSSMVSAMIISDMIKGNHNKYSDIFCPQRFNLSASSKNLAKSLLESISGMVIDKLKIPSKSLKELKRGEGGIINYNNHKVGVFKSKSGKLFWVNPRCSHLGCELKWNQDELTWDCPCHGSRFDYKGNLIDNPATANI